MTFAMAVALRPVSLQSKRGTGPFVEKLRAEATSWLSGEPPLTGELYARIVWFHRRKHGDVDNIIKPILDALSGVVYADDDLIVKCSSERVDTTGTVDLSDTNIPPGLFDKLNSLLAAGHDHILYVEIGPLSSRRVAFGPIDGGA
jgi:hypothetical protein